MKTHIPKHINFVYRQFYVQNIFFPIYIIASFLLKAPWVFLSREVGKSRLGTSGRTGNGIGHNKTETK